MRPLTHRRRPARAHYTHWRIDRLYRRLVKDVTIVQAKFHRYLCDLNRTPAKRASALET